MNWALMGPQATDGHTHTDVVACALGSKNREGPRSGSGGLFEASQRVFQRRFAVRFATFLAGALRAGALRAGAFFAAAFLLAGALRAGAFFLVATSSLLLVGCSLPSREAAPSLVSSSDACI